MSLLPKESRPILKAKRFNKFEASTSLPKIDKEDTNNITKRGFKRSNTDKNDLFSCKRVCTTTSTVTLPKNLAHNRLKKLKEQIQASVKVDKPNTLPSSNRRKHAEIVYDISDTNTKYKRESSSSSKCLYSDSPPSHSSKNLAQRRLQNIKRKLSCGDSKESHLNSDKDKICDAESSTSKHKDDKVTSLKRDVRYVSDSCDYEGSKKVFFGKSSPSSERSENTCTPIREKFKHNSKLLCSTPISQKFNEEYVINKSESAHIFEERSISSSSSSTSQQASKIESDGSFKRQSISERLQINSPQESSSFLQSNNNFLNKIEVTQSWIRNRPDQCSFDKSFDSANSSLTDTTNPNENCFKFDDRSEEMEWSNAEPVDDAADPNKYIINTSDFSKDNNVALKNEEKIKNVCVVVDTNVFISALSKVQDILNLKATGSFKPVIYVPWMVITELDYMKDSCSNSKLSKNIINATKFINNALRSKNPQIVGQTVFDVDKQKHIGTSPDDKIISCCLQAAEKYETVILLSNDINIKNKAMIHDLTACSPNEIIMKLMSKLVKNSKTKKIMHKMGIMCSSIICDCMKVAYGDIWNKMDLMNCPPWSLLECLKRFKKYWTSVFSEKLMKQFTKTVQDLTDLIKTNNYISDDSEEFVEFMKLCVTLCIFLKDMDECRGFVENTLNDITKIA